MLKEFKTKADEKYWEELWEKVDLEKEFAYNKRSPLLNLFKKYLPKHGTILEGGCGNGQWVEVLREEGYDVLGLDYAKKTIKKIKKVFPKAKFVVGDLTKLQFPDNHFAAHISRGVIEHFEEGPRVINSEIHRTLKKKGILIITTPYFNPLKRLKYWSSKKGSGDFYQYHLRKDELLEFHLKKYTLVKVYYSNPLKTIRDELFLSKKSLPKKNKQSTTSKSKKSSLLHRIAEVIEVNQLLCWFAGHTVCLVLEKK